MHAFNYAWSLPVTWQRWQSHHWICRTRKPHAARKLHGSICYRTGVIDNRSWHCVNRHFRPYLLLWPWPWSGDLQIRTLQVFRGDIPDVQIWTSHVKAFESLFIYLFILFPEFRMQPYNSKSREHNTIYTYMDTKGRMCRHLHSINKTKMHLINTMLVHGVIWRRVGDARINRTSILSKERNRFSLMYTWSTLKS